MNRRLFLRHNFLLRRRRRRFSKFKSGNLLLRSFVIQMLAAFFRFFLLEYLNFRFIYKFVQIFKCIRFLKDNDLFRKARFCEKVKIE